MCWIRQPPKYYEGKVQYKYLGTLGTGTYAAVYKVERLQEGGPFAIKTMPLEHATIFQAEVGTLQRFPHTNIIAYVSHFRYKDVLHMVLELASYSLHDAIINRRIDKTTFLECTAMMAAGVAHLHRNKLLYGDIKPQNILITEQNVVKLADLGEVRHMVKPLDRAVGSESHQAPEVTMEGKYGLPTDIYSFGRTLEDMVINTLMEK
ncbi:Serine/threonine-protein kinase Nek9 [Linnemannia hyalina]|uniref:Serine/threonine-protein kinase Nek9 n=1 Tax=Linnemannia hyalina TaxID=64524 RepID=A0A9P7Y3B2_9FUNG|nr:Serine/threonine-protein kinase Nek9 [Linnemannia hyalina]